MLNRRTHPEEGELLRYCDGELRAKESERVTRHLEACWDCRTRLDDLKETIAEYVRYRRDVLEPALPPPPHSWTNLRTEFARLPQRPTFPRRTVWLIACAATAATGVVLYRSNEPRQVAPRAMVRPAPQPVEAERPLPRPRPPLPKNSPGPEDELRVIAALDRIGAGLGDPIDVVRTGDHIAVTCMGLSAERIGQVRTAVAGLPGVRVEVAPKPAAVPAGSPREVIGAPHQGDDPQAADLLLKSSEAMMARAHALRSLAARFPPSVESALSAPARALLADMRVRHQSAVAREVSAIAAAVQPAEIAPAPPDANWQARAARLFNDAEQVDRLLGASYAGSQEARAGDRSALAAAVARLQGDAR